MSATPSTSLYERYAAGAAEIYQQHFVPAIGEPFARRLLASARPLSGERVLDVACGTGIATRLAADAVGPEGKAVGLDINPGMLEVARRVSADDIDWIEAPAEEIPLSSDAFDLVMSAMGLQFMADPIGALREMHRVSSPGGRVVSLTPGPTPPLFEAIDGALVDHVGPEASRFIHAVFRLHDPGDLRRLFQEAGFDDVRTETGSLPLRVAPPADFFWQYVQSTPLAAITAALDGQTRAALEADVVERCEPYADGDATVMEPGLTVVTGRAGHSEEVGG
ncbi:MAG: class I SAM-dependent methyltransferase [Actinomycetota bacterium]